MGLINSTSLLSSFEMTIEELEELKKQKMFIYFYDNNEYYFDNEGELINRLIEPSGKG